MINYMEELTKGLEVFLLEEYDQTLTDEDMKADEIGIAYTTYLFSDNETEEHELQVTFDTASWSFKNYIDGELVATEPRELTDMVGREIACSSFESLLETVIDRGSEIYGN